MKFELWGNVVGARSPPKLHGSSSVRAAGERTEHFYTFSSNLQDHLP